MPKKMSKADKAMLTAVIVIAVLAGGFFLKDILFKPLSVTSDAETQLKSEYTTRWSNRLDGDITSAQSFGNSGENELFTWSGSSIGNVVVTPDGEMISIFGNLNDKKDYYGQEVAVLVRYTEGSSNINGLDIFGGLPEGDYIVTLVPRTLDLSKVDVFFNSPVPKATLNVQKPFYINFAGQPRMIVNYIGYKAQFQCDLAPDEVPIAQSFASPFSQNDLAFPVTKWMYPCRPATLRDLLQGETPVTPNPYPLLNKGNTLPVPPNSFITVHYATPNVAGIESPCNPLDSAYMKIGDKWICQKLVPTATTIFRNITTREIISVLSATSFTFSTSSRNNFNIGSSVFTAQQNFNCEFPSDVDIVRPPTPEGCYKSTITYERQDYPLNDKEILQLNNNIVVQYFAGGEVRRDENRLVGTYIFSIVNPFGIDIEGGITLRHRQEGKIRIKLTNNLPSNDVMIRINQKIKNTNQFLPEEVITLNANRADNFFDVNVDTANLGVNEITIQAFYSIEADAKILLPSDKIKINVEILGEQPSIVRFVEVEKPVIVEKPIIVKTSETPFWMSVFVILFLAGIGFLTWKRYEKKFGK